MQGPDFIGPVKHARGEIREDGKVFWGYAKGVPQWASPEVYARRLAAWAKRLEDYKTWRRENPDAAKALSRKYYTPKKKAAQRKLLARKREAIQQYRRERYQRMREELLARQKAYREAHPEATKAAVRRWLAENKSYVREKRRSHYLTNRDELRAAAKVAYAADPAKAKEFAARRKAAVRKAIPAGYNTAMTVEVYKWASRVQACLGVEMHVDHVVPIARGGHHAHYNLQVLPAVLNLRKSASTEFDLPDCWRRE